jgi:hypothetical protein
MNIQDNNIDRNNEPNSEDNVFEELDVSTKQQYNRLPLRNVLVMSE